MVFCAGRGDEGVGFGEGVRGDDVDGLELLGEGRGVGGSVRDVRVGGRGKAPCKAGEDHDKEHKTFESGVSIYSRRVFTLKKQEREFFVAVGYHAMSWELGLAKAPELSTKGNLSP